MNKKIKIVIADDHNLFVETLESAIKLSDKWKDVEVIFHAYNGIELIEKLKVIKPDVILMDLKMPEMDGIEATAYIKQKYPDIKIIVLSMYDEKKFIIKLIENGANGYISKSASEDELIKAIYAVVISDYYYNENLSEAMVKGWLNKKRIYPSFSPGSGLTKREMEVLKLICKGDTTPEIAHELNLSPRTIEFHRNNLLDKTGAKNAAGLVAFAYQNDLPDLDFSFR